MRDTFKVPTGWNKDVINTQTTYNNLQSLIKSEPNKVISVHAKL